MENPKHLLNCIVIHFLINVLSRETKAKDGAVVASSQPGSLVCGIPSMFSEMRKWQKDEAVPTGGESFPDIRARRLQLSGARSVTGSPLDEREDENVGFQLI